MADFDLLALPTTPILAPSIASVTGDDAFYKHTQSLLLRNTQIANRFDLLPQSACQCRGYRFRVD